MVGIVYAKNAEIAKMSLGKNNQPYLMKNLRLMKGEIIFIWQNKFIVKNVDVPNRPKNFISQITQKNILMKEN